MLENDLLKKAKAGEFDAICALDNRGFFPSAGETLDGFINRLERLKSEYSSMKSDLEQKGQITIEEIVFKADDLIPREMFEAARKENLQRYGFDLDWVPGFFYSPGLLFGGCAWGMPPNYFTLFILRPCFRFKSKWYIYGRQELMAHEMCHAVRFPLEADKYEEMFAYQTSTSSFRRLFGPMVRSPKESYVLVGLIAVLMVVQIWIYNQEKVDYTYFLPLPVIVLMSMMIAYFGFLMIRQHLQNKNYKRLLKMLGGISDKPKPLSFRLNDLEMDALLKKTELSVGSFVQILEEVGAGDLRQKILSSYLRH